jgi:hypothetical protein
MRPVSTLLLFFSFLFVSTGCATIAGGGSSQPVSFQSSPESATFTVQASSGLEMAQGATPSVVSLPRSNEYQVRINLEGYQPQSVALTRGINGWIWGNLFVGWILGFGIDFLTGSAYKLEPASIQVGLRQAGEELYAIVRFLDDSQQLIEEKRLLMVPDAGGNAPIQ